MLAHFVNFNYAMPNPDNWLVRFNRLLEEDSQCYSYNNQQLARLMGVSERQFFRKVKSLTTMSPKQYLRQCRLKKAKEYLIRGDYITVNEVAYSVGYENVGYFINQFEQLFGKRPLQILKEKGWRK